MGTSSKYSSNKILQIIEDKTQHFIIKCYITAAFEHERRKSEYYLYWINTNQKSDIISGKYKYLSFKKMGNKEISFFNDNIKEYTLAIDSDDGYVWDHKSIGFKKDIVKAIQLSIF